ncbi:hypothetical protein [Rhodococcus rhodochrous]|uniref:hypothetical protein n=1 Tax=Rhodococcus rhodochrous TaxID=1829 RepID=UPI00177DE79A|nr:hypothetical protein [Rhodococcus rhodochrous]QOH59847.1 hypothetical protein C6Y44_27525 [Rhodococcus rhodochrous]
MSRDRDIVDAIDALVDEQLERYDTRSGYDYNVGVDKCWHCGEDWHGLPITEHMRKMRRNGYLEPGYRYDEDTTRVLCPGSNVHTAGRPPAGWTIKDCILARPFVGNIPVADLAGFEPIGYLERPVRFSDPDDDPDDDTSDLTFRELSLQDLNRQDFERTRRRRLGRGTLSGRRSHWANEYGRLTVTGPYGDFIGQIVHIDHQRRRYRMQFGVVGFYFDMRTFQDPRSIDGAYHQVFTELRRARDEYAFNQQVRYRIEGDGRVTPVVPAPEPPPPAYAQFPHQSPEEFRRERLGEWPAPEPRPTPPRPRLRFN